MMPRQLIDLIEGKLIDHGIGKIVPPEEAMMAQLEEFAVEMREGTISKIDVPPLRELVSAYLDRHSHIWIDAVSAIVRG